MLARWASVLDGFDFEFTADAISKSEELDYEIIYRPGNKNKNADAMSRPIITQEINSITNPVDNEENIERLQNSDKEVFSLKNHIKKGTQPTINEIKNSSADTRSLYRIYDDLKIINNLLVRKNPKNEQHLQIIIPINLRKKIMSHFHESYVGCHLADEKTTE